MNLHWALTRFTKRGSSTVMVLIAILILAVIGAGLIAMQKNLYLVALKVENEQMQVDVSEHCVQTVVRHLRSITLANSSDPRLTMASVQTPSGLVSHMNTVAFSAVSVPTAKNQYQNTSTSTCTFRYIMQRATQGSIAGGEVNRTRAYGSTDGIEKIYEVRVITCDGGTSCPSVKTETLVYVGVQ